MSSFVGRDRELALLNQELDKVRTGGDRPGRAVSLSGRRRVGKSRMITEFARGSELPYLHFQATDAPTDRELATFADELAASTIPETDGLPRAETWAAALRQLALVLPRESPSIVVLDEVPYLTANDPGFEGALQAAWDQRLSELPVLLILIGSDRSAMERLTSHGRPFYARATEMRLGPLTVSDVAAMTSLPSAEAIDAHLVTGGLPLIVTEWAPGMTLDQFLTEQVNNPLSSLLVSGERVLSSEFPSEAQAKTVLQAIGDGEATFTNIRNAVGEIQQKSLSRSLDILTERRIVVVDSPLATTPSRNPRYRIEDPYMRFWLAFLSDGIRRVEAGQPDVVLANIRRSWMSWRGRAVEPVLRELLTFRRDELPENTAEVGGWWTRTNDVEVDLVGADRAPVANTITFVGSIKWRENAVFEGRDLAALAVARERVPGATRDTPMVAVARVAVADEVRGAGVHCFTADDLVVP